VVAVWVDAPLILFTNSQLPQIKDQSMVMVQIENYSVSTVNIWMQKWLK